MPLVIREGAGIDLYTFDCAKGTSKTGGTDLFSFSGGNSPFERLPLPGGTESY